MISSPSSAKTGSNLYMHLPPVQSSSVIWLPDGAISEITALDCIGELCLRSSETESRHRRECRCQLRSCWLLNWPEKSLRQPILRIHQTGPSECGLESISCGRSASHRH